MKNNQANDCNPISTYSSSTCGFCSTIKQIVKGERKIRPGAHEARPNFSNLHSNFAFSIFK